MQVSGPDARQINKYAIVVSLLSLLLTFLLTLREPLFTWGRETQDTSGGMLTASAAALAVMTGILVYLLSWAELFQYWSRRPASANWTFAVLLLVLNIVGSVILWVYDSRLKTAPQPAPGS